ncbi:MAG: hypothetical protein ACO25L_03770 [Candidatus Nanopelagicales bacterium]
MTSNLGYSKIDEFFIAQVAPGQNQYCKGAKWEEAHGDRVKIRIPGKHPSSSEIPDERLPWAVVLKPTSHGNRNGGSSGIWGGEWVMCCWLDEAKQIPAIIQVFGNNISEFDIRGSKNGTTEFKRVDRFNCGIDAANTQIVGSSKKPTGPAQPTKEEVKDATTDPKSVDVSESGIPKEPTITVNEDGSKTVTVVDADGNKTNYQFKTGEEISPGTLKNLNKIQETNFNLQMSKEATLRGDDAAATYFSNKAAGRDTPLSAYRQQPSFEQQVAQYRPDYTAKDKAEDQLLLRSIQRGELGPVPRDQIDAIINRINGVGGLVRGV